MTAIALDGVTKRYGRFPAVEGLTLDVESGTCLGLFGPNGAGKTTLLRMLATLSVPTEGTIRVGGTELSPDRTDVRSRLGVVLHDTMLYDELTARENLRLHARLHGVDEARSEDLLEVVDLTSHASARPDSFSHGMRKRLSLARALLHDPDVLVLDEPYSGLDRRSQGDLGDLLDEFEDRTVVVATHDFERGFAQCDRALVLDGGTVSLDVSMDRFDDAEAFERRYRSVIGVA
jgi:heme exporter protein A